MRDNKRDLFEEELLSLCEYPSKQVAKDWYNNYHKEIVRDKCTWYGEDYSYSDGLISTLQDTMRFLSSKNLIENIGNPLKYSNLGYYDKPDAQVKENPLNFLKKVVPLLKKYKIGTGYFSLYFPDTEYLFRQKEGGCYYRCFEIDSKDTIDAELCFSTMRNLLDTIWCDSFYIKNDYTAYSGSELFEKMISNGEFEPNLGTISFKISSVDIGDKELFSNPDSVVIEFRNYGFNFRLFVSDMSSLCTSSINVDEIMQNKYADVPFLKSNTSTYGKFQGKRVQMFTKVLEQSKLTECLMGVVQDVSAKYPNVEIGHVELVTSKGISYNDAKSDKGVSVCLTPDYYDIDSTHKVYKDFYKNGKFHCGLLVNIDIGSPYYGYNEG